MASSKIMKKAIKIAGSQPKLAKMTGLSQTAISRHLRGDYRDMRTSTAKRLSKATGIPVEEFYAD